MENATLIMALGLAVLSIASGMLGLGVAFAAVPFLGFFLHDLVHEIQPLSLFLNGITALFSLFGFARSGLAPGYPARHRHHGGRTVRFVACSACGCTLLVGVLLCCRRLPGACFCRKSPALLTRLNLI